MSSAFQNGVETSLSPGPPGMHPISVAGSCGACRSWISRPLMPVCASINTMCLGPRLKFSYLFHGKMWLIHVDPNGPKDLRWHMTGDLKTDGSMCA